MLCEAKAPASLTHLSFCPISLQAHVTIKTTTTMRLARSGIGSMGAVHSETEHFYYCVSNAGSLSLSVKCDTDMIKNETAAGSVRH